MRAIAILLVILYHAHVPGFTGGFVGVDVFFALSGYLITGLLVNELKARESVDLAGFYARRARRLLPASALTVLVTLIVVWLLLGPLDQASYTGTAVASAMYVSNVWFALNATDYLAAPPDTNPFLHLWSLAVEEQFYVVWPALLILVWRFARERTFAVVAVVSGLSLLSTIALQQVGSSQWAFFGSPARAWEFGVGALGALWSARVPGWVGWLGLTGIVVPALAYGPLTTFPGLAAVPPAVGTVLVLVARPEGLQGVLAWRPAQRIGALSYGWYLWHWPVLVVARTLEPGLGVWGGVACSLLALGVAAVSLRLFEAPIRGSAWLGHRPRLSLAGAGGLTLALLACVWFWRSLVGAGLEDARIAPFVQARAEAPAIYERGCHLAPDAVEIVPCPVGNPDASVTLVLWGDSHAAQWFPALEDVARTAGWKLEPMTKSGCPPADLRGVPACDSWRERAISRIRTLSPSLVLLANADVYLGSADSRLLGTTPGEFRAAMIRTLDALAGVPTAVLSPIPKPGFDVPMCLARAVWHPRTGGDCTFSPPVSESKRIEREAGDGRDGVTFIDMASTVCGSMSCAPIANGEIVFRDDNHLTPRFARTLAPILRERIEGLLSEEHSRDVSYPTTKQPAVESRR